MSRYWRSAGLSSSGRRGVSGIVRRNWIRSAKFRNGSRRTGSIGRENWIHWKAILRKFKKQKMTAAKNETAGRELVFSRLLDAPVQLVWKMWVDPEHIKNWWGPEGFINTIRRMEVKPGGR